MRLILLLTLLIPSLGFAQETRPVECRFLSFGSADDSASAIALSDKGAEILCPLSSDRLSKKIVCFAKGDKIPFVSAVDKKPLAIAAIPSGVRSALVIFVRTASAESKPAEPTGWRVFVIEDSPKNFPDGGAYVANFYSNDIRFVIGEHKGQLRAAGSHGYAMPQERDDFNMSAVIFMFRNGESWRTANESSLRFLPGMRYLIFAYVDPVSGRPRINTYQDIAEPTPVPSAPKL